MSQPSPRRPLYPQRLQNAFMQVGEPEAEFRPQRTHLISRVVAGLVIAVGGLVLAAVVLFYLDDFPQGAGFGAVMVVIGVGMAWKMFGLWGQCILLCPNGLVRRRGLKVEACRWQQIKMIRETEDKTSYEIIPGQGAAWTFDDDYTQELAVLAGKLRDLAQRHSIHWEIKKKEKKDE